MQPPIKKHKQLLFLGTQEDESFLPHLKGMVGETGCYIALTPISTITEVELYCSKRGITGVISTNKHLLAKLVGLEGERKSPSLDSYSGSLFQRGGIEYVFINPLEQFHTVNYSRFLAKRFISKLTNPESWAEATIFRWKIIDAANADEVIKYLFSCFLVAIDIETFKTPPSIRCISFTGFKENETGEIESYSYVLPVDSLYNVSIMRNICWNVPAPKVFQLGRYDIAYLTRYNCPVSNYLFDTGNLFHCTYSELPKDLGFLNAFYIRVCQFWKDLANTSNLEDYYRYNALDSWATGNVLIQQLLTVPRYAIDNYLMEFPLIFPCHMAEMLGIKRDVNRLVSVSKKLTEKVEENTKTLAKMVAAPGFNSNSPKQVLQLLHILGHTDITSSGEKELEKARYAHPLSAHIFGKILDIRGDRKLISTYLGVGEDAKEFKERILFSLHPAGTDTGRLASRDSAFWCGLQIQNIPRGDSVKQTLCADTDFLLAEVDLKQAETYDTAYISGDTALIEAIESEKDFHSTNAADFFGRSYDEIWDSVAGKTKNKVLRDLSKRTNHGANYLMGPGVMVDTMGLENVYRARTALGLSKLLTPIQITAELLERFHKKYSGLRSVYYPAVIHEVVTTEKLVGATGWTRFCFGRPDKNKRALNAYVAHCSQSLNAMILNKAWLRIFYDIAINPKYSNDFKLIAQIHDSILFQFREGHEYFCEMVRARMQIPVTVIAKTGIKYTFTVPADIKAGKDGRGVKYWSETE